MQGLLSWAAGVTDRAGVAGRHTGHPGCRPGQRLGVGAQHGSNDHRCADHAGDVVVATPGGGTARWGSKTIRSDQ